MSGILQDADRDALLREPKPVVANRWDHVMWHPGRTDHRNRKARLKVTGDRGSQFRVLWRQSTARPDDFCIVLQFYRSKRTAIQLARCDGCGREHKNGIEFDARAPNGTIARNTPHVHIITERYQLRALESSVYREDDYAEPAVGEYRTFEEALRFFWWTFCFYKDSREGREQFRQPTLFPNTFSIDTFHA